MSIRLRLTLLYSGLLALTLIILGVVLVATVSRVTLSTVETALVDEARNLISSRPARPDFDHEGYDTRRVAAPETYVQARGPDGTILSRTTNLGDFDLPIDSNRLAAAQDGAAWTDIAATDDGRLFILNQPIVNRGQVVGVVQFARSLADQDESLETLRDALLIGSLFVVALAFILGWVLSGAALRPIQRITDTAHVIGLQHDFDRRVDYHGPPDEVGQLATTFNGMLNELQGAYRQTEQALQSQRRMVADASHELRTPLTSIRGNLGLLQRQPPISAEDQGAVMVDVVDETDRLIRLVNDLLVLARSDTGRPLRSEPIAIAPLVDDVCRQARLLGAERTIECEAVPDVAVIGDRDAIKQVLLILLDNALKYTPAGGTISIGATVADRVAALRVRDTGPGITSEALPHIFERFYRSDESRTGSGAGLGLAIAQELIEAQHGQISVKSELGRGSVFTVTLPLA
jgi:two-component system, OmpR family, sensor kinase